MAASIDDVEGRHWQDLHHTYTVRPCLKVVWLTYDPEHHTGWCKTVGMVWFCKATCHITFLKDGECWQVASVQETQQHMIHVSKAETQKHVCKCKMSVCQ